MGVGKGEAFQHAGGHCQKVDGKSGMTAPGNKALSGAGNAVSKGNPFGSVSGLPTYRPSGTGSVNATAILGIYLESVVIRVVSCQSRWCWKICEWNK